ncbi:unnamed protein product [Caenorhabditis auriculariae]|uniref:Uncharacterized protein n=1 Tax=Caenorhabditis auriculariae TaxID=2777116 RepID=A0A8S1HS26_9PELO|nr:unnamed protein product [Caenorhabditis auriculariae]
MEEYEPLNASNSALPPPPPEDDINLSPSIKSDNTKTTTKTSGTKKLRTSSTTKPSKDSVVEMSTSHSSASKEEAMLSCCILAFVLLLASCLVALGIGYFLLDFMRQAGKFTYSSTTTSDSETSTQSGAELLTTKSSFLQRFLANSANKESQSADPDSTFQLAAKPPLENKPATIKVQVETTKLEATTIKAEPTTVVTTKKLRRKPKKPKSTAVPTIADFEAKVSKELEKSP